LKDAAMQLGELGLTEFQYTDLEKESFAGKIPGTHLETLRASAAYNGTMPLRNLERWILGGVAIGGIIVAAGLLRRVPRGPPASPVVPIIVWTLIGILVNAAVCGILSGPHDRYSARVAWLLPFAALLILVRPRESRRADSNVETAQTRAA
jgi:fructose-specific phosphotransferase system IIC component